MGSAIATVTKAAVSEKCTTIASGLSRARFTYISDRTIIAIYGSYGELLDDAVGKARSQGAAERDKLRGEGLKSESEMLGQARLEGMAKLEAGRKQAQEELAKAREQLATERQKLARELAARVLGREVG